MINKFVIYTRKNLTRVIKKHHKVRDHCHYTGKYRGAIKKQKKNR